MGLDVAERNLQESMLSPNEILQLAKRSGLRVHDLIRKNSPVYKERKEELLVLNEEELAQVMSEEPTLIKRPIVQTDGGIVIGLDEEQILRLTGRQV